MEWPAVVELAVLLGSALGLTIAGIFVMTLSARRMLNTIESAWERGRKEVPTPPLHGVRVRVRVWDDQCREHSILGFKKVPRRINNLLSLSLSTLVGSSSHKGGWCQRVHFEISGHYAGYRGWVGLGGSMLYMSLFNDFLSVYGPHSANRCFFQLFGACRLGSFSIISIIQLAPETVGVNAIVFEENSKKHWSKLQVC